MKIQKNGYALPVGSELIEILSKEIQASGKDGNGGLYLNFKDPKYSHERGGFHPVEIMVSGAGIIQYITDFAYVGYPPELVKELDFDFSYGVFQHMGRDFPIGNYQIIRFNLFLKVTLHILEQVQDHDPNLLFLLDIYDQLE